MGAQQGQHRQRLLNRPFGRLLFGAGAVLAPLSAAETANAFPDGISPAQQKQLREDRQAASKPEPEPAAEPAPRSVTPPPAAPKAVAPKAPAAPTHKPIAPAPKVQAAPKPPETPPPVQPTARRGSDGLTPGQRRLIDEDRRAAAAAPSPQATPPPAPPVEAEVMNWNLGRGASWKHGKGTDPNEVDEVAETIAEELPDIVTLQEVYTDYDIPVTGHEDDVDRIVRLVEEETGVTYHAARGSATNKFELDDNIFREELWGNFGNTVLSREPITASQTEQLPSDGDEGRVTQTVVTTVGGVEVTVVNTHVTTGDNDHQPEQLEEAFERAGRPAGPVIFAGDLNAGADATDPLARHEGLTRLTERRGRRCDGSERDAIDQVHGSRGVTGEQRPGFECGPSDHPYQVVDVELPRD